MRYIEILLKLVFLGGSVIFIVTKDISSPWFVAYLVIGFILGLVLIFNKDHPSYRYPANYPRNDRVLLLRKIEGCLLLAFPAIISFM